MSTNAENETFIRAGTEHGIRPESEFAFKRIEWTASKRWLIEFVRQQCWWDKVRRGLPECIKRNSNGWPLQLIGHYLCIKTVNTSHVAIRPVKETLPLWCYLHTRLSIASSNKIHKFFLILRSHFSRRQTILITGLGHLGFRGRSVYIYVWFIFFFPVDNLIIILLACQLLLPLLEWWCSTALVQKQNNPVFSHGSMTISASWWWWLWWRSWWH